MANRFDQCGYLVRQKFGHRRRYVLRIPGEVETRLRRYRGGVSAFAQSLSDAHELLDFYLETACIHSGNGVT